MDKPFISGIKLSEMFYQEAVKPLLDAYFPNLVYSAALIGHGSEVLGFDTPQSMDHDWGPRMMLFLPEEEFQVLLPDVDRMLFEQLPAEVRGFPTRFSRHADGTLMMASNKDAQSHGVEFFTVRRFFSKNLNIDPDRELQIADWLAIPEQVLRTIADGRVFHDGLGQLEPIRMRLHYYPPDVWLYLLAAQWKRIAQEEAFMGRCGQVGDELGSRLVTARLIRDLTKLCFLMERQYAPYTKWLGTAFNHLKCAGQLQPILLQALSAGVWLEREKYLSLAYQATARMHNELGITARLPESVSPFYTRPFLVIKADRFVEAIRAEIRDPEVLALPENLGSVDQFIDSTDVLDFPDRLNRLKLMYQ